MPLVDKQLGLRIQREITKRASIDSQEVRVHCAGTTVYLSGKLKAVRGAEGVNLKHEMEIIERSLRSIPGVREIVNEMDV